MINLEIAPHSKLIDIATLCGALGASLVNYLALQHPWGWRYSVGIGGIIVLLLFIASILFAHLPKIKTPNQEQKIISYRQLLHPKTHPTLVIVVVSGTLSLFSAVGIIQYHGPLILKSTDLPPQTPYLPPLAIAIIQLVVSLLCIYFIRVFGRWKILVFAASTKCISVVALAIQFYITSHRYMYYDTPTLFLIIGGIYVAANTCLAAPNIWLEITFPKEAAVAGSTIETAQASLQSSILVCTLVIAFCKLQKAFFFPYIALDIVCIAFILLLLPETTNITNSDIVREVWSQHWFWKKYVKEDETY